MNGLPSLRASTMTLMISNVAGAALSFVIAALIGRSLGERGLGIYAVCMAWVYPLSMVVEFGFGTLMTRELAQRPHETSAMLITVIMQRLLVGGAGMIALIVAAPLLNADPIIIDGLCLSAPMVILLPLYSTFSAVFRAHSTMRPILLLNVGMLALQVVFTITALVARWGITGVLAANVISSAVQVAAAYAMVRVRYGGQQISVRWSFDALRNLARRSWHFALAALFAALQIRLSILLLESFADTNAVGQFSAANRFIEAARMLPNAFFGALFPALAALATDPITLQRTFARTLRRLRLFGTAAGFGFTMCAVPLIALVYGESFAPAAPVLIILGWSLVFSLLRGGRTLYWYALGREPLVNAINGGVIVVQIALSMGLIPAYGASGAAWVQLIVEAVALIALLGWRDPTRNRACFIGEPGT